MIKGFLGQPGVKDDVMSKEPDERIIITEDSEQHFRSEQDCPICLKTDPQEWTQIDYRIMVSQPPKSFLEFGLQWGCGIFLATHVPKKEKPAREQLFTQYQ